MKGGCLSRAEQRQTGQGEQPAQPGDTGMLLCGKVQEMQGRGKVSAGKFKKCGEEGKSKKWGIFKWRRPERSGKGFKG